MARACSLFPVEVYACAPFWSSRSRFFRRHRLVAHKGNEISAVCRLPETFFRFPGILAHISVQSAASFHGGRIDQQTQPHAKDRHERGGIPHASARIHVPQFLQSAIHVVDVSRLQP